MDTDAILKLETADGDFIELRFGTRDMAVICLHFLKSDIDRCNCRTVVYAEIYMAAENMPVKGSA
jgi:hypothetical protein